MVCNKSVYYPRSKSAKESSPSVESSFGRRVEDKAGRVACGLGALRVVPLLEDDLADATVNRTRRQKDYLVRQKRGLQRAAQRSRCMLGM